MIDSALNITDLKKKTELELNLVRTLPPIPKVMTEILSLFYNDNASRKQLSELISRDLSLLSKILTVANSSYYGHLREVSTIDQAILIIGFKELQYTVSAFSLIDTLKFKSDEQLDFKLFWKHSFGTGIIARRISEEIQVENTEQAFTAGFLHDIGYSILQHFLKYEFAQIHELIRNEKISFLDAEKRVLGMDHQGVGMRLMEKWNFPDAYGESTLYHHTPLLAEKFPELTAIIHLADHISQELSDVKFKPDNNTSIDKSIFKILGFSGEDKLEDYINKIMKDMSGELNSLTV